MNFERYVWLVALIRYFDTDATPRRPMSAVLGAMNVTALAFQAARTEHELPMIADALKGVPDGPMKLAAELAKAREAILEARPTLEDLAHREAKAAGDPNETVMLRLAVPGDALPFREGPAVLPAPAAREPAVVSSSEETLSMPLAAAAGGAALPFQKPAADDADETLMEPNPLKPRSGR